MMRTPRPASMAIGLVAAAGLILSACAGPRANLPQGQSAYTNFPVISKESSSNYKIGPLDTIAVTVFQEPDLTAKDIQVDTSGSVLLPLIGTVMASGKTTEQLAHEIAARLAAKYLDDPQVTVLVQQSASQRVTVEGSVEKPGVYQISGHTTLSDALAMAEGPSKVARLDQVVVFREINGREEGAVFDLSKIRVGGMPDPEILGKDRIVVGLSHVKATVRDVLTAAPFLSIFRPF
jgi:polysaccharide export outer membrane protein